MNDQESWSRMAGVTKGNITLELPDVVEWCERCVLLPTSTRSKNFRMDISPWIEKPLRCNVDNITKTNTVMKPVQTAGSVLGELSMLYWIRFYHGLLQYNWTDDKKALERWRQRVEAILRACKEVCDMLASARQSVDLEIDFGSLYFRMQGAFMSKNLDSDSVNLQLNEEVHTWEPGHLDKARARQTAVLFPKSCDISNAGFKGDQLDKAFRNGTAEYWESACTCGKRHRMQTKWDNRRPDLGGLRYDADGCRRGFMEYDYNKLRPTIQYQMPCGALIHNEDRIARRQMALGGDYSEPTNKGAEVSNRSFTYDAVSVYYIDWMTLIKQKHDALKSRALGDMEPMIKYFQERECIPYDRNEVPLMNIVSVSKGITKSRDGLPKPRNRFFALDRQQGTAAKGEFPYWWLTIRDVRWDEEKQKLRSRLVYEGKVESDEQVIKILDEHGCDRWMGVADSGDDTVHVYQFCMQYGINAIKGGANQFYAHEGGARRIYAPETPLHSMINRPPMFDYVPVDLGAGRSAVLPDPREPLFWFYSKHGIRERLHWMRNETIYETPEDVSDDYRAHQEAEDRTEETMPDGSTAIRWIQLKDRNDQFVNECYIAMQVDMAGMTGLLPNETTDTQGTGRLDNGTAGGSGHS